MQNTAAFLNDVHAELAPSDETLSAVRSRRDDVLARVGDFPGALRTYTSGSIAHRQLIKTPTPTVVWYLTDDRIQIWVQMGKERDQIR